MLASWDFDGSMWRRDWGTDYGSCNLGLHIARQEHLAASKGPVTSSHDPSLRYGLAWPDSILLHRRCHGLQDPRPPAPLSKPNHQCPPPDHFFPGSGLHIVYRHPRQRHSGLVVPKTVSGVEVEMQCRYVEKSGWPGERLQARRRERELSSFLLIFLLYFDIGPGS